MEQRADVFELGHHSAVELLLPGLGLGCVSRAKHSHRLKSRRSIQQHCAIMDDSMGAAAVGTVDSRGNRSRLASRPRFCMMKIGW